MKARGNWKASGLQLREAVSPDSAPNRVRGLMKNGLQLQVAGYRVHLGMVAGFLVMLVGAFLFGASLPGKREGAVAADEGTGVGGEDGEAPSDGQLRPRREQREVAEIRGDVAGGERGEPPRGSSGS